MGDIIGKKFNHWTVIAYADILSTEKMLECICDCGTTRIVRKGNIISGRSSSCGCSRKNSRKLCKPSNGTKLKSYDTKGERIVEDILIAEGGSLILFDNMKNPIPSSMTGKFYFDKQVRMGDIDEFIFDFLIYHTNHLIAIEFDGGLHFKPIFLKDKPLEEFMLRQEHDIRKDKYCETYGIPLLRIRYDQLDIIDKLVHDMLTNPKKYLTSHNPEGDNYYAEWKYSYKQLRQKQ